MQHVPHLRHHVPGLRLATPSGVDVVALRLRRRHGLRLRRASSTRKSHSALLAPPALPAPPARPAVSVPRRTAAVSAPAPLCHPPFATEARQAESAHGTCHASEKSTGYWGQTFCRRARTRTKFLSGNKQQIRGILAAWQRRERVRNRRLRWSHETYRVGVSGRKAQGATGVLLTGAGSVSPNGAPSRVLCRPRAPATGATSLPNTAPRQSSPSSIRT